MKRENTIASLGTLVELRSLDVDRLQADLASQEATRARYRNNLARLDELASGSGASGASGASGGGGGRGGGGGGGGRGGGGSAARSPGTANRRRARLEGV